MVEEYRSLYRKYRPQAPDQILGQEHVVRALAGAVRDGRLAHAFLFSGPRGTGKTSTARILAKMVNCEKGPTAEPDDTCDQCRLIREGRHLDVVEIDAASHGGVDDARELRERAPTAPAEGREKVYIIDEAQRLSREAFDALLKVFEEPPPGVRFVLATTEPHKMPPTIAGRCQKFEFRRVSADVIAGQLTTVAEAESMAITPEAAQAIARQSDGSVRDALSLLDQASVLGGGKVTDEVVAQLVGTPEADVRFALADAIAVGDAREVFSIVHGLVQEGHDLRHFASQVTAHFRDLLLVTASPDDPAIDVPEELIPRLVAQGAKFSAGELDRILSLLLQAQTDMRWTTLPRLTVELALVRAARPETDPQPAALVSRIERLERISGIAEQARQPGSSPAKAEKAGSPPAEGRSGLIPSSGDEPAQEPRASGDEPAQEPRASGDEPAEGTSSSESEPAQGARASGSEPAEEPSSSASEPAEEPSSASEPAAGAPSTGAVDAAMLRRAWPQIVDELKARRKMVLFANAQVATVGAFDGETLELIFPPGREFGASKVDQKQSDLREVLSEMYGITPAITCTVREGAVPEPEPDADVAATPEDAEELLKQQLGAQVVEED